MTLSIQMETNLLSMNKNQTETAPALLDEELHFFSHLTKELSLENSQQAVKLVSAVLQSLRQTLSLENAEILLNRLPDFLKLAFATNWKRDEPQVHVDHLDEFVNLVMDRDNQYRKNMFHDEVQTLSVIILTLKGLSRLVDLENFEGLSNALRQELRGVSEAAA
jgi:uncharacterized protein (DUF2267 family)